MLGGYPFVREMGPREALFQAMLRATGQPMWPDPDDASPAAQAAADAIPEETFAYFNNHMLNDYMAGFRPGYFHKHLYPGPACQVGLLHGRLARCARLQWVTGAQQLRLVFLFCCDPAHLSNFAGS